MKDVTLPRHSKIHQWLHHVFFRQKKDTGKLKLVFFKKFHAGPCRSMVLIFKYLKFLKSLVRYCGLIYHGPQWSFLGLNLGYSHFFDHKHQLCFLNDPS